MQQTKVALVTGVGRKEGIGFEICRQLAAKNNTVILTARTSQKAESLATLLAQEGLPVLGLALDIGDEESISQAAAQIKHQFHGKLDILINNAGELPHSEKVSSGDLKIARKTFDSTLFGAWAVIQIMLPLLRESTSGRIVNVSSGAGSHGDPIYGLASNSAMGSSYAIAKAALNALTAVLAKEVEDTHILVNAVCPGLTATFPGSEAWGARPVSDGARGIVWAALLPDGGPTGGFFRDEKGLSW